MAILPGQRLGAYEIVSAIGAGGMGEVYRARDTRLDRICSRNPFQPTFSAGRPRTLFERQYVSTAIPQTFAHYDVTADGQRFLMVKQAEQVVTHINVVQNWFADLKRHMPRSR